MKIILQVLLPIILLVGCIETKKDELASDGTPLNKSDGSMIDGSVRVQYTDESGARVEEAYRADNGQTLCAANSPSFSPAFRVSLDGGNYELTAQFDEQSVYFSNQYTKFFNLIDKAQAGDTITGGEVAELILRGVRASLLPWEQKINFQQAYESESCRLRPTSASFIVENEGDQPNRRGLSFALDCDQMEQFNQGTISNVSVRFTCLVESNDF